MPLPLFTMPSPSAAPAPATPTALVRRNYVVTPVAEDFFSSTSDVPKQSLQHPQGQAQQLQQPQQQQQEILWIGCSDSWISETDNLGAARESIFVHRNLGAVVSNQGDVSSLSAVEYCVGGLQVKHIVVCGHYDCALIAEDSSEGTDVLHGWCSDLHAIREAEEAHLRSSNLHMTAAEKNRRLVEVSVLAQAEWLRAQPVVRKAMRERDLRVHAFVFDKRAMRCVSLEEDGGVK